MKNASTNEQHAYLEITLENSTESMIDDTAVVFGERPCTFGLLGKGGSKGHLGWVHPVGTNVMVRWRDEKKTQHEVQVDVSNVYHPNMPGNLTFTIAGTNLTVRFEKVDRK